MPEYRERVPWFVEICPAKKYRNLIEDDNVVLVKGKLQVDEDDLKLLTQEFIDIEKLDLRTLYLKTNYILVPKFQSETPGKWIWLF